MIKLEMKETQIRNRGAHYTISYLQGPPRGQTLVYLHGLGSTKKDFLGAFDSPLFREYTLLSFDFPGSGGSSYPEELDVTMLDLVEVTAQLFSQFDLENITLIGHSMGGLVGLLYADSYPEQVRQFINIEGNLAPEDCGVFSRRSVDYPSRGREGEYFKRVIAETSKIDQAGYREFAETFGSNVEPRAFFDYCRSIVAYSDNRHLLDIFAELECPTLFIHGEENSSLSYIPQLQQEGVRVASIAASSHFPVLTNPSALFRAIAGFVEREATNPDTAEEKSRTKLLPKPSPLEIRA
jgi:pimeloyl-ACP methyl ester carboxylesterase